MNSDILSAFAIGAASGMAFVLWVMFVMRRRRSHPSNTFPRRFHIDDFGRIIPDDYYDDEY